MSVVPPVPAAPLAPTPRWLLPLVLAVAALAFLPAMTMGFLGDDFVYVARFFNLPFSGWPRLFTHEWSDGIWGQPLKELRPFAALSFMIDARVWGGWAPGHRLTNLALHLAATALVVRLAWRYSDGQRNAALIAGLLFAVHPVHAETVAWITGRADLLGTAAALGFLVAAETFSAQGGRRPLVLALLALGIGVFTKEFCLTVPLLLVLRWALLDPRAGRAVWVHRARLFAGALGVVALYALARYAAFGRDPGNGFFGWNDAPAWNRQAGYWGWIVPILPFTTGHEPAHAPAMAVLRTLWLTAAALTAVALAVTLTVRRNATAARALFFGGFWWFATTLGLLVVVYFSPRHLYLPSVGLAIGVGLALGTGRIRAVLAGAVILWCAAAHVAALRPWIEAGARSRDALAALDADLAGGDARTLALVSVPETHGPIWLWAWSCPQAVGAPFLRHPVPPERVLERPINYYNGDQWAKARQPVAMVRAASSAAVLLVGTDGSIRHRLVPGPELQAKAAALPAPGLTGDNLTPFLESFFPR
jgi:hypothetical protein